MRACESAYARGGRVQSVWINPGLRTLAGKLRLPLDALHQDLAKPQRRSARAVGFLAMMNLVDVRILVGLIPQPPSSTLFPYTTLFRSAPLESPAPSEARENN